MVGAERHSEGRIAVFMVDALGRVCLIHLRLYPVLQRPKVSEEELDTFPEGNRPPDSRVRQGDSDAGD